MEVTRFNKRTQESINNYLVALRHVNLDIDVLPTKPAVLDEDEFNCTLIIDVLMYESYSMSAHYWGATMPTICRYRQALFNYMRGAIDADELAERTTEPVNIEELLEEKSCLEVEANAIADELDLLWF
jgi:hypothetical protein